VSKFDRRYWKTDEEDHDVSRSIECCDNFVMPSN
jgi:hypothetical protein